MKRTERHHLKDNELATQIAHAREVMSDRRREVSAAAIAIAVIAVVAIGYFSWHERTESRAHELLASAMAVLQARVGPPTSPGLYATESAKAEAALVKFKAAADAYPTTDAGLYARYEQAALLMQLGRAAEAVKVYQDVIARAGSSLYGQTARLGVAEAQARAGQFDQAIGALKELAQGTDGRLPLDGILMELGRTYREAGKRADAQQTFNRLVEEYPESPFVGDARRELAALKAT